MRKTPLQQLRSNFEAADDAMRRYPSGGTPNRSWLGEQLMLIRILEEAGTISGERDGLFDGLLDTLMIQKRHCDRYYNMMRELANADPPDRDRLKHVVDEFINSLSQHQRDCADFISKFGDRLALKETV